MRIALILSSLEAGGAERVMSLMANHWAARGWEVDLITLHAAGKEFYPLDPRVHRLGLDLIHPSSGLLQALLSNLRRIRRLRSSLRDSGAQAVISFGEQTNVLVLLASRGLSLPVIVSERVAPSHHSVGRVWERLRRWLYPRAAAVVVQSQDIAAWMAEAIPAARICIIPNPVQPPMATPAAKPGPRPYMVAMGRLSEQKGFDLLLAAFAACRERFPDWSLMILGEGPQRAALLSEVERLGLGDSVQLPGLVQEPVGILQRAEFFVLSSRYEGFPNALLEAMACGLPALSFDCAGGPDSIIRDGRDGLLVPAEDVTALATAMERMMSDVSLRERMAAEARTVTERFALAPIMQRWESLLRLDSNEGR